MRNFYNQPRNKIFDKMFGKGIRQLQADPTLDVSKCKCCQCDEVQCKGCMQGDIITPDAGCCPSRDEGLIFEYERPYWETRGIECCPSNPPYLCCPDPQGPCCSQCLDENGNYICPPCGGLFTCPGGAGIQDSPGGAFDPNGPGPGIPPEIDPDPGGGGGGCCISTQPWSRCCNQGNKEETNVRFYYNYIGKYFKVHYTPTGKYSGPRSGITPRLCSDCDPESHQESAGSECGNPLYNTQFSCTDFSTLSQPLGLELDELCSSSCVNIPWENCSCMGSGQRKDKKGGPNPGVNSKRLSRYRKRQMEKDPYYRWLLDIMCYDAGNIQFTPEKFFVAELGDPSAQILFNPSAGTLYDHLVGVVHCEHWYEQATCRDLNPEHGDPNGIVGGWIDDPWNPGTPLGYNTSKLAPRFWIYACSGVPLFDFEIEDAVERGIIGEDERDRIYLAFAQQLTPPQDLMKKLSAGGYFDTGDWRQEALSEIRQLRGNTFTAPFYGKIINGDPNFGACCIDLGPSGYTCINGSTEQCGLCGGNFFPALSCSESFCDTQACTTMKFLGPVRKRWFVENSNIPPVFPSYPKAITGPNISSPAKARPNTISPAPESALGEQFSDGGILETLQLPSDLIADPWSGNYPKKPDFPGLEQETEEYKAFKLWRDAQWVYMHARPGGWSHVCPGYGYGAEGEEIDLLQFVKIPDLPRAVGNGEILGCLEGVDGRPQRDIEITGCIVPDGLCLYTDPNTGELKNSPQLSCGIPRVCIGIECAASQMCADYPERGGGGTPCANLALKANCDGIRFLWYIQSFGLGGGVGCVRTVNSYLYKVNVTNGNFDEACPYKCRQLQIPKQIANAVPSLYSNAKAHREWCDSILRAIEQNGADPETLGERLCPGTYCYGPNEPVGGYYGLEEVCCSPNRINGKTHAPPPPENYTHPARNKEECPVYPGPGYPTIYDGQFLGVPVNFNPVGCCWRCRMEDGIPVPDSYLGLLDYFACHNSQPEDIALFDNFAVTGRGFIYPDSINSPSGECPVLWAGECACGTNSPDNVPPASSGEFCSNPDNPPPPPPPPGGG